MKSDPQAGPSEAVRHGGGRRTKNLQGDREKRKRREERKRTERRKKERKGEESKRERFIYAYMGVKHPLRTVKRLLKTRKDGG